jgi:hypothetical protein
MRKGIILGIGILIILLALAGIGSAISDFSGSCSSCHNPCCSKTNVATSAGIFFNSTHRYNDSSITPPACAECHVNANGGNFGLISGAGTNLTIGECAYCHIKLVDDWNNSTHSNPTNSSKAVVTCVTCHKEHNSSNGITLNKTCMDSGCHLGSSALKHGSTTGYNITQCKYCHMPKVLTVNLSTPLDTASHTWDFRTQLVDQGDERHAAVFNTLKNVTKNDKVTKASCDMCHGTSDIPSVNFRTAYRATKHYNVSANNVSSNSNTPYCTDCHKTALTTEAKKINETNTCRNSGCHNTMNGTHASKTGGADCVNCHFNSSNTLKTHNLSFDNGNDLKYSCNLCHKADTNKSIDPQIDEWNASVHNDKVVGLGTDGYNHYYGKFNQTTGVASSRENSCNKCHSPMDWNPGIAESVTTKVPLTANFKGIICNVCHNIHDMDNWINNTGRVYAWYNRDAIKISSTVYQSSYTNVTDTTELCGNCHSNVRYGNTGPGWASATATTPIKPHGFPAKDLFMGSPKQSGQGFECIDCHMYKNTSYGNDTRNDSLKIAGHSFAVNETALQTSCGTTCHDGTNFKTIPDRIEEIRTKTQDKWNVTNISVMAALDRWNKSTDVKSLSADKISVAYWNLKLVESDESWGVHNPELAISLLDEAATLANASNDSLGRALTSNVNLFEGWNLVALNGTPANTTPDYVMASVKDNITVVWHYNASSITKWELYDPAMPSSLNSLTRMVSGEGYWIYAKIDDVWTV